MNKGVFKAILGVILIGMIVCMSSCRTASKIEYNNRVDTCYISKFDKEKEFVHDSIFIKEKGDTVFYDRWHTRVQIVERVDTVIRYVDHVVKEEV